MCDLMIIGCESEALELRQKAAQEQDLDFKKGF